MKITGIWNDTDDFKMHNSLLIILLAGHKSRVILFYAHFVITFRMIKTGRVFAKEKICCQTGVAEPGQSRNYLRPGAGAEIIFY